jgi:hypothetical protein
MEECGSAGYNKVVTMGGAAVAFFRLSGVELHFRGLCGGSIGHHRRGTVLRTSEVKGV